MGSVSARTASAANAIGFAAWDGGAIEVHLDSMGDAARASGQAGLASSMAGNPSLLGSAWAHTGKWWSLQLGALDGVRIRVEAASPADFSPGLAIWAIGNAGPFDGGTTSFGAEIAASGFGTPHTFNATGALGDAGTLWMQQGQGGNAKELLGYAVSGPSVVGATGWDESIEHGAHDRRLTDDYVASVSGNAGAGFAELQLGGVQSGWYLIYVGGTDHARAGGLYDLHVVPEASTAALLALGLGVVARARRSTRSY
ncbi:MAG: pyruvate-binding protein [Proteobacteria bacterium]|nr:MAG: pyruvate-binding protein [Pseudomonadota bacterium]